jgi:FlgN protein
MFQLWDDIADKEHKHCSLRRDETAWGGKKVEAVETGIQNTYHRQVSLLEDLRDCLELERESLINVDIDQLWELMGQKHTVLTDIQRTGSEIRCFMERRFPGSEEKGRATASKEWLWFTELNRRAGLLKKEIRRRLGENMAFIQDTLGFFDELIGIFVSSGGRTGEYNRLTRPAERKTPRIYHREV